MFQAFLKTFSLTTTDALMIVVGAVLFYIFWQALKKILLVDYVKFYEVREKAIEAAVGGAGAVRAQANELSGKYEAELLAARVEAIKQKLLMIEQAKAKVTQELSDAKLAAQQKLIAARAETQQSLAKLQANASVEADTLATDIAHRIQQSLLESR